MATAMSTEPGHAAPSIPGRAPADGGSRGTLSPFAAAASALGRNGFVHGLLGLVLLAVVTEILARTGLVQARYLPPATSILGRLWDLLLTPSFLAQIGQTLRGAVLGLLLATPFGIVIGVLLGMSPLALSSTRVLVDLLRPIPAVAVVPLLVLTVGLGEQTIILTVALAAVWPILLNTVHGVQDVDGVALQTARVFGAGRLRRIATVVLPSSAPAIGAGLRISASLALVVTVATELIVGSGTGIGAFILNSSTVSFQASSVYAAVTMAGLLGLAVNSSAVALEKVCFPWHGRKERS